MFCCRCRRSTMLVLSLARVASILFNFAAISARFLTFGSSRAFWACSFSPPALERGDSDSASSAFRERGRDFSPLLPLFPLLLLPRVSVERPFLSRPSGGDPSGVATVRNCLSKISRSAIFILPPPPPAAAPSEGLRVLSCWVEKPPVAFAAFTLPTLCAPP